MTKIIPRRVQVEGREGRAIAMSAVYMQVAFPDGSICIYHRRLNNLEVLKDETVEEQVPQVPGAAAAQ